MISCRGQRQLFTTQGTTHLSWERDETVTLPNDSVKKFIPVKWLRVSQLRGLAALHRETPRPRDFATCGRRRGRASSSHRWQGDCRPSRSRSARGAREIALQAGAGRHPGGKRSGIRVLREEQCPEGEGD